MTSFVSVLSLVVVLSVSACFALPMIGDEQSSTGFPSFDAVTREMEIERFSSEQTPWSSMTTDLPVSEASPWPLTSSATNEKDLSEEPKSSTRKMVSSTTEKYLGHLEDSTKKSVKKLSTSTPKVGQEESSEEHSKESEGSKAFYDPKALESVSTVATNQMQFDENRESIPQLPKESSTKKSSTSPRPKPVDEEEESRPAKKLKPLNQGSTLVLFLLAAFLLCACLMASTLAFVKSQQSLKRKSRIIEMEAHLDEHHHPLLFQSQLDK